ncbi:hypothetical protein Cus16_1167 [Curtobacterium sp. ER1/6]|nr:hypothetical protein Cus16_1167 [Curtobacterium sp. ER1/6]
MRHLDLLQHRVRGPGRERVRRQQQRRQPVRRREGGGGEHVRGARADRRRAGEGRTTTVHAREPDGLVHHRLLVARLVVGQQTRLLHVQLLDRLTEARDVAVPEDAEDPRDRALAVVAVDGPLVREERDEGLADGHAAGGGHRSDSFS